MPITNDKMLIAYSGTHGTGKTTAAFHRAFSSKVSFPDKTVTIITERAALCPFPINKEAKEESQLWIFTNQMQAELEALNKFDIVISDRTIVDCIAYTQTMGFFNLAASMLEIAQHHISRYSQIILRHVSHDYVFNDGVRDSIDYKWRMAIHENLIEIYKMLNVEVEHGID